MESKFNLKIAKEPIGFIRIIQFIFAILAFATTAGFSFNSKLKVDCNSKSNGTVLPYVIKYPFSATLSFEGDFNCTDNNASDHETRTASYDHKTSSEFYVAVGILSLLYSLFIEGVYVLANRLYQSKPLIPVGDLFATVLLTIFWFSGWCAWVASVGDIKTFQGHLVGEVCRTRSDRCTDLKTGKWSLLIISLIFGLVNVLLWANSIWFVYKETHFSRKPNTDLPGPNTYITQP